MLGPRTTVDPKQPDAHRRRLPRLGERARGSQAAAFDRRGSVDARAALLARCSSASRCRASGARGGSSSSSRSGGSGSPRSSPAELRLGEASDPAALAAKRVFGIGERFLLERRAADLAEEAGVPLAALDLALFNFGQAETARATMGSPAEPEPELQARVERALGL